SIVCDIALRTCGRCRRTCRTPPFRSSKSALGLCWVTGFILLFAGQSAFQLTNNAEHDFVRAAANRNEAAVAKRPAQRIVPGITHAAPILQAGICDFPYQSPAFQL